jgi:hypothetical protein
MNHRICWECNARGEHLEVLASVVYENRLIRAMSMLTVTQWQQLRTLLAQPASADAGKSTREKDSREAAALQGHLLEHCRDVRTADAGLMGWALAALCKPASYEPVVYTWALDCAVCGSCLEFQRGDLLNNQLRYGGEVPPLYTNLPAPTVPEGWQLVPVEPTRHMLASTCSSRNPALRAEVLRMAAEDWAKILSAAPSHNQKEKS